MRFYWRIVRFAASFLWYGTHIYIVSRWRKSEDRLFRVAELQSRGCSAFCRILGIDVQVNGVVSIDQPTLIASNHPGILDPWVLASRFLVAFVAKVEMKTWPVFGVIAQACGIIFADRSNRMKTSGLIREIQERIRLGIPVLIFPEGTTSGEDMLQPFKTAGFAAVEGMPDACVLPVYMWQELVDGEASTSASREKIFWARNMGMLEHSRRAIEPRKMTIEILVGNPIQTEGRSRKELASLAYESIKSLERATRNEHPVVSPVRLGT